jgi:LysM repeat protein
MGDYNGHLFDPWKRGDLVVVEIARSYWETGKGTRRYTEWMVGTRHTTPSAPALKVSFGNCGPYTTTRADTLWRIAYRYQQKASTIIGQTFETREALEAAL